MTVAIIQERLASYQCHSALEEDQALREISQEIILAALARSDFFNVAGFQGGTCLRIFHRLNRFSEDLDFALLRPQSDFMLVRYVKKLQQELALFGYDFEVQDRATAAVQSVFLKDDSLGRLLHLQYPQRSGPARKLRIKLEIDTSPPSGAEYEMPTIDFPYPAAVRKFDLPSLFAGKIHALLCRNHLKGRDWYDFVWYTARTIEINHALLSSALTQAGPWSGRNIQTDTHWCVEQLNRKISEIDWKEARQDVQRFVKPVELPSLELWSKEFFLGQCKKLLSAMR